MGIGLFGRLAQGLRSTLQTVAAGEAYLARKTEAKPPERFPELGVLQFGTRFREMRNAINPFLGSVRPATGPSVARPGVEQFKGTGGAFAPELGMQLTSGMRGLGSSLVQLQGTVETLQSLPMLQEASASPQLQQLSKLAGADFQAGLSVLPPEQAKLLVTQRLMEKIGEMIQMISNIMRAAHDTAMNSIRNIRA